MRRIPPALSALLLLACAAAAHDAPRDKYGCHRDMKAGGYHCHWGDFKDREFPSREYGRRILGNAAKAKALVMRYYKENKDSPELGTPYKGELDEDLEGIGFQADWELRQTQDGELLYSPSARNYTPVPRSWQLAGLKLAGRTPPPEKETAADDARPDTGAVFTGAGRRASMGDALEVVRDGRTVKVRLSSVDCPEFRQPFWKEARELSAKLTEGREVRVEPRGRDRYGRMTAEVFIGGKDLAEELVEAGLAWISPDAGEAGERLKKPFAKARRKRRGLWAGEAPVPPWEWRRRAVRRRKGRGEDRSKPQCVKDADCVPCGKTCISAEVFAIKKCPRTVIKSCECRSGLCRSSRR